MKVGVIGLGTMGMGAALNLVRKGPSRDRLRRPRAARAELAAAGGAAVVSPAELPADTRGRGGVRGQRRADRGCAVRRARLPGQLAKGAVILCCATVAPEAARALDTEDRRGGLPDARCAGLRRQGRRAGRAP